MECETLVVAKHLKLYNVTSAISHLVFCTYDVITRKRLSLSQFGRERV